MLADQDKNLDHGTFIAGLAVSGNTLNGNAICPEPDGTSLVDIDIFPDELRFQNYYPNDIEDFFDEISNAVIDIRTKHVVRIYNLSLNTDNPITLGQYSVFAKRIDDIAEKNDVIFFISAGNIAPQDKRMEWPADENQALVALVTARNDGIQAPAESIRNVSVAALNPPGLSTCLPYAPTCYSGRGPGLRTGVKPDLAHVGGTDSLDPSLGSGLFSISPTGNVNDGSGTSFSAPLVAKTAAMLDHMIEGNVSRETIIALLIHHAQIPGPLASKKLLTVSRDFVGFGMPLGSQEILEGKDHEITLVFAYRIQKGRQISFEFTWPISLTNPDGKCRGDARLTLVSSPPIDSNFGDELVRINVDVALQQEDFDRFGTSMWKGRLEPTYLSKHSNGPAIEAERIRHGFKWSPTKTFERSMAGVGKSSNWRLSVNYLERPGETISDEGVPFTAILTIRDPQGAAPVFNEMRAQLTSAGVTIEDIRTAARVATRI